MSNRRRLSSGSSGLVGLTLEDENEDELDAIAIATSHGGSLSSFSGGGSSRGGSRRRSSFGGSVTLSKSPQKNAAEQARIAEMYKTVIKLSSENKINEKNSWSLDLIDHMGKLIKEDSGGSRGVNFQKASCTLDASVKIYSHRVDDTHASSHRILESLSRSGMGEEDDGNGERGNAKVGSHSSSHRLNIAETIEKKVDKINDNSVDKAQATDPLFHKMSKAFDEGGAKGMLMTNLRVSSHGSCLVFNVISESEAKGDEAIIEQKNTNGEEIVTEAAVSSTNSEATNDVVTPDPSAQTTIKEPTMTFINISDLIYKSGFTAADLATMEICSHLDEYRSALGVKPSDAGVFDPATFDQYFSAVAVPASAPAPSSSSGSLTPSKMVAADNAMESQYNSNDIGGSGDDYGCAYDDDDDNEYGGYDETPAEGEVGPGDFVHSPMKPRASIGGRLSLPGKDVAAAKISWDTVFDSSSSSSLSPKSVAAEVTKDGDQQSQIASSAYAGEELEKGNAPVVVVGEIVSGNDYSFFPSLHPLSRSQSNSWAGAKHWKFGLKSHNATTTAPSSSTPSPSDAASGASDAGDGDAPAPAPSSKGNKKKKEAFLIDFSAERLSEDVFAVHKGRGDPTQLTAAAIEKADLAAENRELLLPADAHVQVADLFRYAFFAKLIPNIKLKQNLFLFSLSLSIREFFVPT